MTVVAERFGLPWPIPVSVHDADNVLVCTERRDLMAPGPHWGAWCDKIKLLDGAIVPMIPKEAEQSFLDRYAALAGGING